MDEGEDEGEDKVNVTYVHRGSVTRFLALDTSLHALNPALPESYLSNLVGMSSIVGQVLVHGPVQLIPPHDWLGSNSDLVWLRENWPNLLGSGLYLI